MHRAKSFSRVNFFRFPLTLNDLAGKLDAKTLLKITWDKLQAPGETVTDNFETFAVNQYGRTLAERFSAQLLSKIVGRSNTQTIYSHIGTEIKRTRSKNLYPLFLIGRGAKAETLGW